MREYTVADGDDAMPTLGPPVARLNGRCTIMLRCEFHDRRLWLDVQHASGGFLADIPEDGSFTGALTRQCFVLAGHLGADVRDVLVDDPEARTMVVLACRLWVAELPWTPARRDVTIAFIDASGTRIGVERRMIPERLRDPSPRV